MSIIHGRNPSFRQALPYGWNLSPSGEKYSWQDGKSGGAFCRILPVKEGACGVRLCCRSVLVALREAYGSAPAARRQHALQQRQPVFSTRANATCIPGRIACASGGQGYFHHNSATERGMKQAFLFCKTTLMFGKIAADRKCRGFVSWTSAVSEHTAAFLSDSTFPSMAATTAEEKGLQAYPLISASRRIQPDFVFPTKTSGSSGNCKNGIRKSARTNAPTKRRREVLPEVLQPIPTRLVLTADVMP